MLVLRFPWSYWSPRREAVVLILLFALFIVGLRSYFAFCDYVYDTLYDALEDTAATLKGFWLGNFTLPAVTMPPRYGFNMTYQFQVNETQAEMLKQWGYRARVLFWGGCTLQGTFHFLENYRINISTKHHFSLEYFPIIDIKVVYVAYICSGP
ncbi:MAG: hypothetical protein QXU47_07265 [Candidatus Bathyarchaeia archaeon]